MGEGGGGDVGEDVWLETSGEHFGDGGGGDEGEELGSSSERCRGCRFHLASVRSLELCAVAGATMGLLAAIAVARSTRPASMESVDDARPFGVGGSAAA